MLARVGLRRRRGRKLRLLDFVPHQAGVLGVPERYLLDDEFHGTLAAGAVNGTSATPGPGTRVAVDTDGDALSIGSGVLAFANPNSSWGDPGLWYGGITRIAGRLMIAQLTIAATNTYKNVGWDTNQSGELSDDLYLQNDGTIRLLIAGGATLGTYTAAAHTFCLVQRAAGVYFFVKGGGFTNWTLLFVRSASTSSPLYPGIGIYSGVPTSSFIRVPSALWLPTPLASDQFTRANGAIGTSETSGPDSQACLARTWTGATWTVAANEAINTPTEGGELVVNGTMEADANWSNESSPVTNERSAAQKHSGSYSRHFEVDSRFDGIQGDLFSTVAGTWYIFIAWSYPDDHTSTRVVWYDGDGTTMIPGETVTHIQDTWNQVLRVGRSDVSGAGSKTVFTSNPETTGNWYIDDVSVKPLTLSTLFASLESSTADVVAQVELDVVTAFTHAGLVLNLDDAATPANFVIAWHDGTNAKLDKCVAGTYTSVISAAATYAAGATLVVVKDGTAYSLFYNNAKVGATSTVSDAGIVDNTLHGMFSTYSGNQLDNFLVMPRGGGAYADLNRWSGVNP